MSAPLPPISRPLATIVLLTSGLLGVSALLLGVLAAAAPMLDREQRPSWALFGFEIVVAAAAALGVLTGRNKFADGPGLALACVAGTVLVGSGLGWAGAGRQLLGHSLTPVLGARVLAAGVLALVGAWTVLSRVPGAVSLAVRGAALLGVVACGAGVLVLPAGRKLLDGVGSAGPAVQFVAAIGGFVVAAVLLSAGVHLVIRAFEMGRPGSSAPRA